jgi:hypothetical protein
MALARIVTRYPELTDVLRRQLQEQGYTVETLDPEAASTTVADLEIQLELCDPDDVLRRAAELATSLQADIAIAPGVLTGAVLAGAVADVASAAEPAPVVPSEVATAVPSDDAVPVPSVGASKDIDQQEGPCAVHDRLPGIAGRFGDRLGRWTARASELLVLCRAAFLERVEQSRVRIGELRESRQERLLELMRRRLEARLRTVELEGVRRAAAAALAQEDMDTPPGFAQAKRSLSPPEAKTWSIRVSKREATAVGVITAVALFVAGGLALISLRAHQDESANQGSKAQGGGFTIPGPQPGLVQPVRPSPVLRKPTPKPVTQRTHRIQHNVPGHNRDQVANDVVVRHVATPRATPRTQANGWKHFSDTNN